jgi:hypothetical protein
MTTALRSTDVPLIGLSMGRSPRKTHRAIAPSGTDTKNSAGWTNTTFIRLS